MSDTKSEERRRASKIAATLLGIQRQLVRDVPGFENVVDSGLFQRNSYLTDNDTRIALVYLQDHSSPIEDLDSRVAESVRRYLKSTGKIDEIDELTVNAKVVSLKE